VIASRLGSMAELVEHGVTGLLFPPGDATALQAAMRWAENHPQEMAQMGRNARARYDALYTPETNHTVLLSIYRAARDELAAPIRAA
jgi:glycosyltransferase involved in cell wall biosynthesis